MMGFFDGKLMRIQQSSLPIICSLFSSTRYVRRHHPSIRKLSRQVNEIFLSKRISLNTSIPSSFSQIAGYSVRFAFKKAIARLKDTFQKRPEFSVNLPVSSKLHNPKECSATDLVPQDSNDDELLVAARIRFDYIFASVVTIGLVFFFTNMHNISELLKFSSRLENTLRNCNGLIIFESKDKDDS